MTSARAVAAGALALALSACGQPAPPGPGASSVSSAAAQTQSSATTGLPTQSSASAATTVPVTPSPPPGSGAAPAASATPGSITLAFAGDANAFEAAGSATTAGLGEAGRLLAAADFAMVNLETALADDQTGLVKQPKLYTFVTGSAFPQMLQREGVDLVSLANNHAMDFGPEGMARTLAIRQASSLPMIGVGRTEDEAFAPWTGTVKGRGLSVFVGNDVLEENMDWRPTGQQPGVAMVKTKAGLDRLVSGVAAARRADPARIIVVYMHWGTDYQVCTDARQMLIAQRLADAGATVVVGTHAHRVQRVTSVSQTLVAYGLGNFTFFSTRVETRETGVLTVTVPPSGRPTWAWAPGAIVDGRPVLLSGPDRQQALDRQRSLSC